MAAPENEQQEPQKPSGPSAPQETTRRDFFKRVGAFVFSLTLLSETKPAPGSCDQECDGTPPNTHCDAPGEQDGSCGWWDADGGCGGWNAEYERMEVDDHCWVTDDRDQGCSPPCSDAHDSDDDCNTADGPEDGSCGDCDDDHDTDDHCGQPNPGDDPDGLCGHPHYVGLDEDNNCTATHGPDSFCGTYDLSYQWLGYVADVDQYCATSGNDNTRTFVTPRGCEDHSSPEWHYSGS